MLPVLKRGNIPLSCIYIEEDKGDRIREDGVEEKRCALLDLELEHFNVGFLVFDALLELNLLVLCKVVKGILERLKIAAKVGKLLRVLLGV